MQADSQFDQPVAKDWRSRDSVAGGGARELDERAGGGRGAGFEGLRGAPGIDDGDLVDAGNGAARGAAFFGAELAVALFVRVIGERNAGIAALL